MAVAKSPFKMKGVKEPNDSHGHLGFKFHLIPETKARPLYLEVQFTPLDLKKYRY